MVYIRDRKKDIVVLHGGDGDSTKLINVDKNDNDNGPTTCPQSKIRSTKLFLVLSPKGVVDRSFINICIGMLFLIVLTLFTGSAFLKLGSSVAGPSIGASSSSSDRLSEKQRQQQHVPLLDFGRNRNVSSIILNIGSNSDPILPRYEDGPCAMAIAFEPIVPHTIKPHPALHVVGAAVTGSGSDTGLAIMRVYNDNGLSSSLSTPTETSFWNENKKRGDGTIRVVPAVPFRSVLQSLSSYTIDFIMTDMQGFDFIAVSSAGDLLLDLRVKRLVTEVYRGVQPTYEGVKNDFCNDWLPYMTSIGYLFEGFVENVPGYANQKEALHSCRTTAKNERKSAGLSENNAKWRHPTAVATAAAADGGSRRPYYYRAQHQFTAKEYESCNVA